MKRLVVRLVLSVLMSVLCFSVAQAAITYPLQLSAHILPPYGCRLSDYVVQGMERLNLTVLQRDLRYSNYDFLVRMQVKQGTKIVISSTAGYTVKSGQLTRLNSANLFNGLTADITAQDKYKENGFCLNEGAYEFVFQAFDAKNTALPVSEPVYFHTYLSKALPPACVFPANGSCVDYKSAAVSFAWMEKSVSMPSNGKRYSLEVYEMPEGFDGTDRAENLAGASEPVYRKDDINGNVTVHTAPISAGMFIKGRTYVWRVRSYSADFGQADSRVSGHVENNGYSQYSAFKFGTCVDVEDVWKKKDQAAIGAVTYDSSKKPVLESVDTSGAVAVVEWLHEPEKFCGYVVEWNMADTALAPWGQKIVSEKDSFAYISGLSYGVDYIVRLRGVICNGSEEQAYSACADNVLSFRLEKREDAECGNPVPQVTSLVSLKEAMKEGDVLSANGHDVTVLTCEMNVSGSDTTFTGTGLVSYGFLKSFFNLTVKFDNVKINDRKELLQGMVYANTDLNNCLDLNLNRLANKGSAGSGPAQRQTAKFDEFSSADNIPENKAGLAGGTMYAWDADGNRVECGTLEDTSCASNNLFVDSRHGEVLFDNLEGMEWNPPFDREKRPFDRNLTFSDYYENLDGYSVPWIGVPEGGATKVKATLLQGASVNPNDVHFVLRTGSQSIRLNAKRIDGNSSVATYEVPVFADKAGDKGAYLELSAVVSTGEGACSQQLVLGVAKVYALKREHFNVRLVPCHNVSIDEDAIAKKLNEIYKPLGKTFTVTEDELFYGDSAFAFIADTFDVKNISRRSTETEDMTFLKYIYREERGFSEDSVYLFVLPKANIDGVTGFMPRGKHVGYLFCDKNEAIDARTVAHELGHGLFTLEHAFDYITDKTVGKTDNLMDYSDGENLKVWQWTHMDNHGPVVPFFDDAEDGLFSDSDCKNVWLTHCAPSLSSVVENHLGLFEELNSSTGKRYWHQNNSEMNVENFPDWKCTVRDNVDYIKKIHESESGDIVLTDLKKGCVYMCKTTTSEFTGTYWFTTVFVYAFKDNPTLSDYKIHKTSDYASNKRVKVCYENCSVGDAFVCFFDENGALEAVLQLCFGKGGKENAEFWRDYLLKANDFEEDKPTDRYIVSVNDATIRKSEDRTKFENKNIPMGTEVVIESESEVNGKVVAYVKLVNSYPELFYYTTKSNLTKIEVLEKPEKKEIKRTVKSVILPFANEESREIKESEEYYVVAKCGSYLRISNTENVSWETSEGYWVKLGAFIESGGTIECLIDEKYFFKQRARECYSSCVDIVKNANGGIYKNPGRWALANVDENNNEVLHMDCYAEAIKALDASLENGVPVIVGLDWKKPSKLYNFDKVTDHWVIIVGRDSDDEGVYYTYFEVAQSNEDKYEDGEKKGTSAVYNRFYKTSEGYLKAKKNTVNSQKGSIPVVTAIECAVTNCCCSKDYFTDEKTINCDCEEKEFHNRRNNNKDTGIYEQNRAKGNLLKFR